MLHGVYSREEATSIFGVNTVESALPFVVGTAPIHQVAGSTPSLGTLVKLTCWQDVLDTFGYVHDFGRYSLSEFLYYYFRIANAAPVLAVNVFDPSAVVGDEAFEALTLVNGQATMATAGRLVLAVHTDVTHATEYIEGTDYTLTYDEDGYAVITRISTGAIPSATSTVHVGYQAINAVLCGVNSAAVITALDEIEKSYAQFGDVPSVIACPGYSQDAAVAAAMVAKTEWGGGWYAHALCDIPTDAATGADALAEVAAWKSDNGYTDSAQDALWPLVQLGTDVFHLSTVVAGALAQADLANGGVPFTSASNLQLPITGAQVAAGTDVFLTQKQANDSLNANGVTTVLNLGARGWVLWGNRTGAYPGSTDPKDIWRNYRRMLIWMQNTCQQTLLAKVDQPGNLRQIESIVNSLNIWLNGLAAAGALVGHPQVEFRREDNPDTDLLAGKYTFRVSVTPPTPMESINLVWQIDVAQLATLFE